MITTLSEFDSSGIAQQILIDHFGHKLENGINFVDVGAGQPIHYSNSYNFRVYPGSVIVSIDANPKNCKMFHDMGFEALQYGVVKEDGMGEMIFRECFNNTFGLAYSSLTYHKKSVPTTDYIEYNVPTLSLTSILKKHYPNLTNIDILDVDTEGNEMDVLHGLDFDYYQPKILIIENISGEYDEFYDYFGYEKYARCAHNDILIHKK